MTSASSAKKESAGALFAKYVSQNILGMIGVSAYVLADTFFISLAEGADGITALNLVLPLYSLIFAIGSMIGVGSATRFKIYQARGDKEAGFYFTNSILFAFIFGLLFSLAGLFVPGAIVRLLGGTDEIVAIGIPYTRIFLLFAPFFMMNYICNAFVRNDGNPSLAMAATFSSSIFNIIMDYVLMFPLKMGMAGAALATAFSPIVGISICSIHLFSGKSSVHLQRQYPSLRRLGRACQLGVAAFMGEISSGVTTMVFNFLILGLAGNTGIAAYGVILYVNVIFYAFFMGYSTGSSPIVGYHYGDKNYAELKNLYRKGLVIVGAGSIFLTAAAIIFAAPISGFFVGYDADLSKMAYHAFVLYSTSFLFCGFNIWSSGFFTALNNGFVSAVIAFGRTFLFQGIAIIVLPYIWGLDGVWLTMLVAEAMTLVVAVFFFLRNKSQYQYL